MAVTAVRSDLYTGHSHFEATLENLTPGTSYVYRVGREGAWCGPYSFTTAIDTDRVSFLFMGDVQEGYDYWGQELEAAVATHPGLKFRAPGRRLVDRSNSGKIQEQNGRILSASY